MNKDKDIFSFFSREDIHHMEKYKLLSYQALPPDFDADIYKELNRDLIHLANQDVKLHYITHGIIENRKYKYELPADFDAEIYKDLNSDLIHLTNHEVKAHYMAFGKNECRKYKYELPVDFDEVVYKDLNKDLAHLTTQEVKAHYMMFGKNECRKYKHEQPVNICSVIHKENEKLPFDFKVSEYKLLNQDLKHFSDEDAKTHYITQGVKEKRLYKNILPPDFNVSEYKLINQDLKHLSDEDATNHYITQGIKENRSYKIYNNSGGNLSHKGIMSNCIFLINHHNSYAGATIFLYDLACYMQQHLFSNVIVVDVCYLEILDKKYGHKLKYSPLYHGGNYEELIKLINEYNPIFIYSNSLSIIVKHIDKFLYYIDKIIFHFHETVSMLGDYNENVRLIPKKQKIYVVSERIKNDYMNNFGFTNINLFPPFLGKDKVNYINLKYNEPSDDIIEIDKTKITFGMCGVDLERKGYSLFVECAKRMPEYNFIWVGGTRNNSINCNNLVHIENTSNPYKYYKLFDYLLFTSKDDPCPIVLLECMYLGIPCIILEGNISYDHNVIGYNKIYDHNNDVLNVTDYIRTLDVKKNQTRQSSLTQYIEENFIIPFIFNLKKHQKPNTVLNISLFNVKDLTYYKNIINYIKIIYNNEIDIMIICKTEQKFNYNYNFINYNDKIVCYGIDNVDNSILKSIVNNKLYYDKLIFTPNKGYDVASLLIGLYYDNTYEFLMHLHSKSNLNWRNELFKIIHHNIQSQNNIDTIVCTKFYNTYNTNDLNHPIILNYPNIFKITDYNFNFNAGKVFITKSIYLKELYDNFQDIYNLCTDEDKNDEYWCEIMRNKTIFNKYYKNYSNCVFNEPINIKSREKLIEYNAKNYISLMKLGFRGIPDCQFEHALERYIGYLTTYNKNVKFC